MFGKKDVLVKESKNPTKEDKTKVPDKNSGLRLPDGPDQGFVFYEE